MSSQIRKLLEMIRFSHTIFALPFALSSAVIAWKYEPFRFLDLLGIVLCMGTARTCAMSFNRIVDRDLDAKNPRTAGRHLPSGTITLRTAVLFSVWTGLLFVVVTGLFTLREPANYWPLYLSGPVLVFICAYSFTKRFTFLCHVWLGASLMLAPLAAWIAIRGMVDLQTPLLLGLGVLFWVTGFDILYACQDAEFDRKAKLNSIPAKFGVRGALRIAFVSHLLMLGVLLSLFYIEPELKQIYLGGVCLIALLVLFQHSLVSASDLSRVNQAFFQVNAVISMGLFLTVLIEVLV
jgi:4-hydroxybenzoate polyprenyltransferase